MEGLQGVPANVRGLIESAGITDGQVERRSTDADKLYALARAGKCMTCEAPLGEATTCIVTQHGVVAVFCSVVCMTDMHTVGWLQEQHDDIVEKIKFRGGTGDEFNEDDEDEDGWETLRAG